MALAQATAQADAADWAAFVTPLPEQGRDGREVEHQWQRAAVGGPWTVEPKGALGPAERTLMELMVQGRWAQAQAWLKEADPPVQGRDAEGRTLLTLAVRGGQPVLVRELLRRGAPMDQWGDGGFTPLGWAAYLGQDVIVHELLRQGADPLAPSITGQAPLHLAAAAGQTRCVAALLKARPLSAWLQLYNRSGRHALAEAAHFGRLNVVRQLAQAGWPWDAPDAHGLNALHAAAAGGHWHVADHLAAQGVSPPSVLTQILLDQRTP